VQLKKAYNPVTNVLLHMKTTGGNPVKESILYMVGYMDLQE
jgi:hypothetical protein